MGIVKAQMPSKEYFILKRALSVILHDTGAYCDREDYFDQGPLDIIVFQVLLLAISLLSLFKDHAY